MPVRLLLALILAAAACLSTVASAATPVGAGDMAPDFTLADQDGRTHSLAAERGKRPVVLVFYRGYW